MFTVTIIPTYLLTQCSRVLLEKLIGSHLVKKFPALYETRRFITALQEPATCPHAKPDQSIPCPTTQFLNINLNIILPSTPGSSKCSLFLRFPHQNHVCTSLIPHTRYMPCPSHSSRFDHPYNIW